MTDWRHEWRKCHCGETFRPKREAQRFCSELCRDADKKHRKRSGDKTGHARHGASYRLLGRPHPGLA